MPGSSGRGASAMRIRNSRSRRRLTISCAVFFLGNSPKVSSMYWISRAPVSNGYCLIRYSDGAALKRPFYNAEVSQRAAGERARWLAAVLIVATIAATGVIVRLWPVATPVPLVASRHVHLYQAPAALQPVNLVRGVRLEADRVRPATAGHDVPNEVDAIQPDVAPSTVPELPAETLQAVASEVAAHTAAEDGPPP